MSQTVAEILKIDLKPTQGVLAEMNSDGDLRTIWDRDVPEEVTAARETFAKMKAKGYMAYRVNKSGDRGEVIDRFDPQAQTIILAPPLQGGR